MNKNRRNVNSATYVQTLTSREYKAHIKATQQYTNTTQKAEDALHDSFVNVLEKDITLEYPKAYIAYSSFNVLRNNSRHDNRTIGWTEATENYNLEPNYELKYYSDEYLVQEAISKLDPKQKLLMETFMAEGTIVKAARKLKVNENTAKANYRHAMFKIQKYLVDNNYELSNT